MRRCGTISRQEVRVGSWVAALALAWAFASEAQSWADDATKIGPDITGVWRLYGRFEEDGELRTTSEHALKFIMSGQFCVTFADPKTGLVKIHHGGRYTLEEDKYSETILYANESTRALLRRTFQFEIQVDEDTLTQKSPGSSSGEVWKRVKPGRSRPQDNGDSAPADDLSQTKRKLGALFQSGQLLQAAKEAAEALEIVPEDTELILVAGRALTELGEHDKARVYLKRLIALDQPSSWRAAWAHFCLAEAQYAKGDSDGAREELLLALRGQPTRQARRQAAALLSKVGGHPALDDWRPVETEHFRIHFPRDTEVDDLQQYAKQKEADLSRLQQFFKAELPGKIDLFVWNDQSNSEPVLFRPLGFAKPKYLLVHTRLSQTPGHELTHVLSYHAVSPTRQSRFIDEGTAVFFDLTRRDRMAVARSAVRQANLQTVSIAKMWETADSVPEAILYPVAGAFVARLIETGGRDKFITLLKCQTLEHAREVYGDQFSEITARLERDLTSQSDSRSQGD